MRVGLVTGIALSLAVVVAGTAAAQPVSPPAVEGPSPSAPAPSASSAPEDPRPGQALTACGSGEVNKGISILATLYAETRIPSFVFNQARCYQQNGQLEPARERFREYLRIGKEEPPEDIQRAQAFVQEIDQELALRAAIHDAHPEQQRYRGALRTTSVVLAAASVVAFGTGAFLTSRMKAKEDEIAEQVDPERPGGADTARVSQLVSQGTRLETWQYVSYGLGVAALAGAATTFGLSGWSFRDEVALAPVVSPRALGGTVRLRF